MMVMLFSIAFALVPLLFALGLGIATGWLWGQGRKEQAALVLGGGIVLGMLLYGLAMYGVFALVNQIH